MKLFRRRRDVNPSVPVSPPPGMKWEISKTILTSGGKPIVELALWPEHVIVNEWGRSPSGDRRVAFRHYLLERVNEDLHFTSKLVLRDYERTRREERALADARLAAERTNR